MAIKNKKRVTKQSSGGKKKMVLRRKAKHRKRKGEGLETQTAAVEGDAMPASGIAKNCIDSDVSKDSLATRQEVGARPTVEESPVDASATETAAPAGLPPRTREDGVDVAGWSVTAVKLPISNSDTMDRFFDQWKVRCPEMTYLENSLRFEHKASGFVYAFSASEALARCAFTAPSPSSGQHTTTRQGPTGEGAVVAEETTTAEEGGQAKTKPETGADPTDTHAPRPTTGQQQVNHVKCSMAKIWETKPRTVSPDVEVQPIQATFDWTYTTDYKGHFTKGKLSACQESFDIALLMRKDPILYYDEVLLFEDELHDNGMSTLSCKVRVMPAFWFVILRFWLRVDDVLIRLYDTRVFHKYGSDYVLREHQTREMTFEELKQRRWPTESGFYTDPNKIAQKFPVKSKHTERITIA